MTYKSRFRGLIPPLIIYTTIFRVVVRYLPQAGGHFAHFVGVVSP